MYSKKIWIVSELFYPDDTSTGYIMTEIAKAFSDYTEVHVLCTSVYDNSLVASGKLPSNIIIHRVSSWGLDKNKIFSRILRLLVVSIEMGIYGLSNFKRTDTIFMVTNPALSLPLFAFIKKLRGFKLFVLVHDVFPENLIPGGVIKSSSQFSYKILKKTFDWSYSQAEKLLVLGHDMQSLLIDKTKKSKLEVKIIENWAEINQISPQLFSSNDIVKKLHLEDKIVLLFAGNLGRLQGLQKLFNNIRNVENSLLHFIFIGSGAEKEKLKEFTLKNKIVNISFLDPLHRSKQNIFLNACHFGIVTLDERFIGLGVPSKSYNILAAGKPIFYLGHPDTEVYKMIQKHNCGVALNASDDIQIINTLNALSFKDIDYFRSKESEIRELACKRFSKEFILSKFIEEVIHG